MIFRVVLCLCTLVSLAGGCYAKSQPNRARLSVQTQKDSLTLSNGLVSIQLDSKHNYICRRLWRNDKPEQLLTKEIRMVGDLEHKVNGQWKGLLESQAKLVSKKLDRSGDLLRLTVKWQNEYLEATKTIELPSGKPFCRIRYSCYVYQKIPLRIMAAPLVQFPAWMNRYYYQNRFDKVFEFDRLAKNGRILTEEPGRWYACGNKKEGVVIALPGLKRDYHLFAWPPEFFRGRNLLRNINLATTGIAFPHRVAQGAIGDDIFTADLVIGPYQGDPQQAVDEMLKVYPADSIKFDDVPVNKTAKLACSNNGINVWADYSHSHHLQKERLSAESSLDKPFELAGAKNQRVAMQLIVRPQKEVQLKSVKVEGISFTREVRLMRYVKLTKASAAFPLRDASQYPVNWPDPLVPFKPVTCVPDLNQGMLVSFSIPSEAKADKYKGKISLLFSNGIKTVIPVRLRVFDFALPIPRSYQTKSDLNMFMVKHRSHEKGEDPKIQMKYAKMLTDYNLAPQDSVSGWHGLVTSELSKQWSTVSLPRQASMIAFEGTFSPHMDWKTKKLIRYPQSGITRQQYEDFLVEIYRRNIDTMRKQGVKGPIYAFATDGPLLNPDVRALVFSVIRKVKEIDPEIRIVGCVKNNFDSEIAENFDVVVMTVELDRKRQQTVNKALDDERIQSRWTYVNHWCSIDSPPVALRTIYWEQFFRNISGCWHWGALASAWSKQKDLYNPDVKGLLGSCWGIGYLIYPPESSADSGPVPSLRLLQIMSGIDDFEYLKIWQSLKSQNSKANETELEKQMKTFSDLSVSTENFDKIAPEQLEEFRVQIGNEIERINKAKRTKEY